MGYDTVPLGKKHVNKTKASLCFRLEHNARGSKCIFQVLEKM